MSAEPDDDELDPNPYAVPEAVASGAAETPHDRFILEQVAPLLRPRERVRYTACLVQQPSPAKLLALCVAMGAVLGVAVFAFGAVVLGGLPAPVLGGIGGAVVATAIMFATRPYLAAVTKRRVVLFRSRTGLLGVRRANLGVEEIRWKDVARVEVGGIANNRSLRFVFHDGGERTLRISPWSRFVSGQRAFFEFAQRFEPSRTERPR